MLKPKRNRLRNDMDKTFINNISAHKNIFRDKNKNMPNTYLAMRKEQV